MITKTMVGGDFNFRRVYPEYIVDDVEKPISKEQRRTLIELIYSRVSNPEEVERRLAEIESYNFADGEEAIGNFLFNRCN